MSYTLSILPRAVKELKRLPPDVRRRVVDRIGALVDDPRPPQCRKLTGRDGYRLRVGAYRVLYDVDDASESIVVLHVGHRSNVYH